MFSTDNWYTYWFMTQSFNREIYSHRIEIPLTGWLITLYEEWQILKRWKCVRLCVICFHKTFIWWWGQGFGGVDMVKGPQSHNYHFKALRLESVYKLLLVETLARYVSQLLILMTMVFKGYEGGGVKWGWELSHLWGIVLYFLAVKAWGGGG